MFRKKGGHGLKTFAEMIKGQSESFTVRQMFRTVGESYPLVIEDLLLTTRRRRVKFEAEIHRRLNSRAAKALCDSEVSALLGRDCRYPRRAVRRRRPWFVEKSDIPHCVRGEGALQQDAAHFRGRDARVHRPYIFQKSTISAGYLFTSNAYLIWESLRKVYSQRENNARIFQLSNEIGNFKQGTQTLGMYYARLRSSWEELSRYDSSSSGQLAHQVKLFLFHLRQQRFMQRLWRRLGCFSFLWGLNPDFEYARVHLLDRTPFPTLEEVHAYCFSDQSRRSPMPPVSGIPSETFAMAIRYAYLAPPSVPLQTSHTSLPSLSLLPADFGNSRPSRKKCDYCGK
ncbi:hypothetical protein GIB67_041770 [Kingdonia uniflora]|uniref:Retrotransposon gag domain-containing protein n=1 Tax=Kingdonia uniflora TaxID=39325 RepID=A0A7J7NDB9_9MAGN|nr:hypothetical protein GIB67_041770 [Kingdonia uniflora]